MSTPTQTDVEESILLSTKKYMGMDPDYDAFDPDVKMGINTALFALAQMGVGPVEGITVLDESTTWSDLLGIGPLRNMGAVKMYIYITTRKIVDPPGASNHLAAFDDVLTEYEWRIKARVEEVEHDQRVAESRSDL